MLSRPAAAQTQGSFVIGTGDPTGTYYPVGGLLASIVTAPPGGGPCWPGDPCGVAGLVAIAQSSAGSVANLDALVTGRVDSAFCQADVAYLARGGEAGFEASDFGDLRALASLYPEVAQVVTTAAGPWPPRRLATGARLSGTNLSASVVLPAFAIDERTERVDMNPSDALHAIGTGEVDGFLTISGVPTSAVTEALNLGARFITPDPDVARATVLNRAHWRLLTIPAATYAAATEMRQLSIAVPALWLTHADLDAELAYAVLEAVWAPAARRILDDGHPAAAQVTLATALQGLSVPLHAGARDFYRQAGLLAGSRRVGDRE